jgi:tetratricopeptide (TPR) repeat protein
MALAEVAGKRKDKAALRGALEAAHRFDPTQLDALHGLYELATDDKRDADALSALREIARLDQHDRKAWPLLLSKLVDAQAWAEARQVGEGALYVDVENADVHVLYARALSAGGDHETASFELESALLCDGKPADHAEQHALLAKERLAAGDAAGARVHRDQALQLDPANADAKALRL